MNSFIGNQPATSFDTVRKQVSTSNSGTTITLDYPVTSVADIRLTINAVVQSYDNYSVSGSTLTVGGTLNNDRVEILFVGRTYGSIAPSDASIVTSSLQDGAVTGAKLNTDVISAQTALGATPADTDELLVSDSGVLKRVDYSYLKSVNTPAFEAKPSADVDITSGTNTKVQFNTELFDTDGCYDHSTNYRFTPNVAGKYYIWSIVGCNSKNNANLETVEVRLYKNGTWENTAHFDFRTNNARFAAPMVASVITFNGSSDYVESYAKIDDSSGDPNTQANYYSRFGGYKLIGA